MMSSKLPTATLGKVWDLSDVDRDGFLDRYEFTIAMHLVFRALQVNHYLIYIQKRLNE
jgi:epidermal growth factor receptor substrate 15